MSFHFSHDWSKTILENGLSSGYCTECALHFTDPGAAFRCRPSTDDSGKPAPEPSEPIDYAAITRGLSAS